MRPRIAGGGFVALALAVALSPVAAPLPVRAADVVAPAALAATERAPELCLVCRVREGATHAEEVRAVVAHEGRDYGLCSAACAKEFATDPVAYLPPVLPRPVPVPDLALTDLAGAPVTWERFAGQVVLVDFWATWCVPCRKAMPELSALHERWSARGFSVLGISIDEDGAKKVAKFAREKRIAYPLALDSAAAPVWERFRVKAVPAAFLVDREGRIVAQWTGTSPDPGELEAKLAELLPADATAD